MTVYIVMSMTFDASSGGDCVLVSYDVSGAARSVAARVCQIVFGRKRTVGNRRREEPGFIHRAGVVWIGQSVRAMPANEADDLAARLRHLGVRVAMAHMAIPRGGLEVFRRPRLNMLTTECERDPVGSASRLCHDPVILDRRTFSVNRSRSRADQARARSPSSALDSGRASW